MSEPLFLIRNHAIRLTRTFFEKKGFTEAWTNQLTKQPAVEPYIDSFKVGDKFLATSPELALKKVITLSSSKNSIYEIAHSFRDEIISKSHLHEFIMLEWYSTKSKIEEFPNFVQEYINFLKSNLDDSKDFSLKKINLSDIWKSEIGIDPEEFSKKILYDSMDILIKKGNIPIVEKKSKISTIEIFSQVLDVILSKWFKKTEPGLTAIQGFPKIVRGMAQTKNNLALRTEIYLNGIEIANGYQEEYDPLEIIDLLNNCNKIRKKRGVPQYQIDDETLNLMHRLKGVSGMALGLERVLGQICKIKDISHFSI